MTLTELYRRVLLKLRVVDATESASAEDTQVISDAYPAVYDMLLTKGLVAWTVTEDIPLYAVIPLTDMLACQCASEFGKEPNYPEGGLDMSPPSLAEKMLRGQLAKSYVPYPAQSEYY